MKRCIELFLAVLMLLALFCGCSAKNPAEEATGGWEPIGHMETQYAEQFSVDYYPEGYKLITLGDGSRFVVIPEGGALPKNLPAEITPLRQPLNNIYVAATASMCLFDALNCLDNVRFSGTKADGWYIENARRAMEEGNILFSGKYSEPDYELLLSEGCPLAIESTMIGHASEVKDKLEELGIAVLVDQSSLEEHPLGRTEWIRLYGAILGCEDQADAVFQKQVDLLNGIDQTQKTERTAAFFYISSSGKVVARRSGDYVSKMIELAGGSYVFSNLGDPDSAASTVTIEMETFFAAAKDADVIIYNSTIGGEVADLQELLRKSDLLREFKAVREGNVWCTSQNMYQETTQLGQMIQSFHMIFSGEADDLDELPFLTRLQ